MCQKEAYRTFQMSKDSNEEIHLPKLTHCSVEFVQVVSQIYLAFKNSFSAVDLTARLFVVNYISETINRIFNTKMCSNLSTTCPSKTIQLVNSC